MVSNKFILGKYDLKSYTSEDISEFAITLEGEGKEYLPKTHHYNDLNAFSNPSERDEMQTEGILYRGYIEDEKIYLQEQSGPRLVKKR